MDSGNSIELCLKNGSKVVVKRLRDRNRYLQEIRGYRYQDREMLSALYLANSKDSLVLKYIGNRWIENLSSGLDLLDILFGGQNELWNGKSHGDAALWNFRLLDEKVYLLDWESFSDSGGWYFQDHFRLILTWNQIKGRRIYECYECVEFERIKRKVPKRTIISILHSEIEAREDNAYYKLLISFYD